MSETQIGNISDIHNLSFNTDIKANDLIIRKIKEANPGIADSIDWEDFIFPISSSLDADNKRVVTCIIKPGSSLDVYRKYNKPNGDISAIGRFTYSDNLKLETILLECGYKKLYNLDDFDVVVEKLRNIAGLTVHVSDTGNDTHTWKSVTIGPEVKQSQLRDNSLYLESSRYNTYWYKYEEDSVPGDSNGYWETDYEFYRLDKEVDGSIPNITALISGVFVINSTKTARNSVETKELPDFTNSDLNISRNDISTISASD